MGDGVRPSQVERRGRKAGAAGLGGEHKTWIIIKSYSIQRELSEKENLDYTIARTTDLYSTIIVNYPHRNPIFYI